MSRCNETGVEGSVNAVKHAVTFGLAVIIVLLAVGVLMTSIVVTYPNQYTVVKQFGEIVSVRTESGISFKAPVIQDVERINKDLMFYDIAPSNVITKDKKTMVVDSYVLWKVTDPTKFIRQLRGNRGNAESRLNTIVFNAMKTTISNMTQDEVILSRDGKVVVSDFTEDVVTDDIVVDEEIQQKVVEIKSLTEEIESNLADCSDYGIEIVTTQVKVLDLPDDNKDAVYKRMISERNNVAAGYEAQGDSEAQMIINTTDKEISMMKADAEAQAEKVIAEGEAEYMRILSDAYNNEEKAEFYSFVRSLDADRGSLKDGTLMLDANSPLARVFYTN